MSTATVKQGEAKILRFVCTAGGVAVSLSGATFAFTVKRKKSDTTALISKADAAFTKTDVASGIVKLPLSATDTNIAAGTYVGELKVTFSASNIDKSADLDFVIEQAVGS